MKQIFVRSAANKKDKCIDSDILECMTYSLRDPKFHINEMLMPAKMERDRISFFSGSDIRFGMLLSQDINKLEYRVDNDPWCSKRWSTGEFFVLPADSEVSFAWNNNIPHMVNIIGFRLSTDFLFDVAKQYFEIKSSYEDFSICHKFFNAELKKIIQLLHIEINKGKSCKLYVESCIQLIILHLLRYVKNTQAEARNLDHKYSRKSLGNVFDYIEENLQSSISLESLANEANVSATHFINLFKKTTGKTPNQYLIDRRIERSKDLLKNTTLPITEIAYEVGYSYSSHFATAFKQIVGFTPRQYRNE